MGRAFTVIVGVVWMLLVGTASANPLGPVPPDSSLPQSRCGGMHFSPHVVTAGKHSRIVGTVTPGCGFPKDNSFDWSVTGGLEAVKGCGHDELTCTLRAVSPTGTYQIACINGANGQGSWESCDYYGVLPSYYCVSTLARDAGEPIASASSCHRVSPEEKQSARNQRDLEYLAAAGYAVCAGTTPPPGNAYCAWIAFGFTVLAIANNRIAEDPFDPHWRQIFRQRPINVPSFRVSPQLRPAANRVTKWMRAEAKADALVQAVGISIDRANSATDHRNKLWADRQFRAARSFALKAATTLGAELRLRPRAITALERLGVPTTVSPSAFANFQQQVAANGLPAQITRAAPRADRAPVLAELKQAILGAHPQSIPSPIAALGSRQALSAERKERAALLRFARTGR